MQRHGIAVLGAFIMGLDVDKKGIGRQIANAAISYGVDTLNLTFLTPLPGTHLWETMESQGRIAADSFPEDWKYYTLGFPVASYMNLSWAEALQEFTSCLGRFYSYPRIFHRFFAGLLRNRRPVTNVGTLISNIVYRRNLHLDMKAFKEFDVSRGVPYDKKQQLEPAVVE